MAKTRNADPVVIDPSSLSPQAPEEFTNRGWLYYTNKDFAKAEADFRTALKHLSEDPDVFYALGLTLSVNGQPQEAIEKFELCLASLDKIEERDRQMMLSRLVKGQINRIKSGDWSIVSK